MSARTAAVVGFALFLPGAVILGMLLLHIDPSFGPLDRWVRPITHSEPHLLGSLIALTFLLVLPIVALVINLGAVRRMQRAGAGFLALPVNAGLVLATLALLATFVGAFVVDQYPCWIGVPNCD